jgi:hypothetical protein
MSVTVSTIWTQGDLRFLDLMVAKVSLHPFTLSLLPWRLTAPQKGPPYPCVLGTLTRTHVYAIFLLKMQVTTVQGQHFTFLL